MARPGRKRAQEIRKKQLQKKRVALPAAALIGLDEETTGPSHAARQTRRAAIAQVDEPPSG